MKASCIPSWETSYRSSLILHWVMLPFWMHS